MRNERKQGWQPAAFGLCPLPLSHFQRRMLARSAQLTLHTARLPATAGRRRLALQHLGTMCTASPQKVVRAAPVHHDISQVVFTEEEVKARVAELGRCGLGRHQFQAAPERQTALWPAAHALAALPARRELAAEYSGKQPHIVGVRARGLACI